MELVFQKVLSAEQVFEQITGNIL